MELRQLQYFVTLAEELHFGRAAAREHIVQSSLSQQLQRLERDLGVTLVDRNTHQVRLSAAGAAFLLEARQILAHVDRAVVVAQRASRSTPTLRVGIVDASYDSMALILHDVQRQFPDLEIHQVEAGVPEQYGRLIDGSLDVGLGRASLAPPAVASELFRLDPLGVLVSEEHRFAAEGRGSGGRAGRRTVAARRGGTGTGIQSVRHRVVPLGGFHPDPASGQRGEHPGFPRPGDGGSLRAVRAGVLRLAVDRDRVAATGRSAVAVSVVGVVARR